MDKALQTGLFTSWASMLRVVADAHIVRRHIDSGDPLWGKVFGGAIIFLFACMLLILFGFISYSFGHWILSIFRWFHARHVVRFGKEGLATLVARRSSLMTTRGGPLTLVVTLEFSSSDGIVHRREFLNPPTWPTCRRSAASTGSFTIQPIRMIL